MPVARVNTRSLKGLRYNLPANRPTATAILQHQPRPVAVYLIPSSMDSAFDAAVDELIALRPEIDAWMGRVADGEMPLLPQ